MQDAQRTGLAALTLALVLAGSALRADKARADTPVVHVTSKTSSFELAAQMPTSGPFVLEYAFDGTVDAATLDVWPERVRTCADRPPPQGSRQTYHLSFTLKTENGKTLGTTTVPHLQVAQNFCFRFSTNPIATPDPDALAQAVRAHSKLIANADDAFALASELLRAAAVGFCEPDGKPSNKLPRCNKIDLQPLEYPLLEAGLQVFQDEKDVESKNKEAADFDHRVTELKDAPKGERNADKEQRLKALSDTQAKHDAAVSKSLAAAQKAQDSRKQAEAKQRDVAIAYFKDHLRTVSTTTLVDVTSQTNDFNNYVSPEIGMAVAWPIMKNPELTLLPYTAMNIYFQPVDRELPLGQLVNPVGQRLSLSVGLSLTQQLKARRVDFSPTVAKTFGILGIGYRILPFARIAALVVLANATPSGGLSGESKLVMGGAVAVSGDVDLITLIGNSLSK
jgi:hypothetical protein